MPESPDDKQRRLSPPRETRKERQQKGGALAPPIFQSATFLFESAAELAAFHGGGHPERSFYSRYGNPTLTAAESRLARLEGAEASLLYASGMAAVSSVLIALLSPGARAVFMGETYRHSRDFAERILARYGVEVHFTAGNDLASLDAVPEGPVRLLFTEIPSNPTLRVPDIGRIAEWARARKARLVVDATIASPILFRPLEHGADLAVHSGTKFLSGHNDLMAGAVSGSAPLIEALREQQALLGAIAGPSDAFLLDRGMKTLAVRMERQSETALRLAEFLAGHKGIQKVHYPGLAGHPDHEAACRYLGAFGGLLSFELEGGPEAADRLVDVLEVPVLAAGFGGTESQVEHHARMAYADLGLEGARERGVPPGLIRYSVGLEAYEDLRADLAQGLGKI